MDYSIVVATRNRTDALRLSVPRMLAQSRPPTELIVVDSSDDHRPVADLIQEATAGHKVRVQIRHSERGLTLQRNIGLQLVTEPLVFFPDDDSIWYPGVASEILSVYEKDTEGKISAVCAAEASLPPADFAVQRAAYRMTNRDRIIQRLAGLRTRVEHALFPDPARLLGRSFYDKYPLADWADSMAVVPVEWMTGFRMTFRTEAVRQFQFDTNLKLYSLFEDRDASFGAWQRGAVVAALRAKVFHYRSPERRDGGRRMGVSQLLNLAYLMAKYSEPGDPSRKHLLRFARYKCFLYRLGAKDTFGRDRFVGAKDALAELPAFLAAKPEDAASLYQKTMQKCLS